MADNIPVNTLDGTPSVATDDVNGVHYPKNKIYLGAENSVDGPIDGGIGSASGTTLRVVSAINDPNLSVLASGVSPGGSGTSPSAVYVMGGYDAGTPGIVPIGSTPNGDMLVNVSNISTITEYQEGQAADDDPAGGTIIAPRTDSLIQRVGTGLNVAIVGTRFGELHVKDAPSVEGGLTMYKTISTSGTNATNIKNTSGQIYSIECYSTNASTRWLKFYNKSSTPTVGTDTPVKTLMVSESSPITLYVNKGLAFSSGIGFALTTGISDSDVGDVGNEEVVVNIDYV